MRKEIAIGIDIGGTHIEVAGVDMVAENIIESSRSHLSVDNKASKEAILDRWAAAMNQCYQLLGDIQLQGIGMAITGPFNYRTGIAGYEGNDKYQSLYGCDVAKELRPRLDMPETPLRFINDATAFGVGEAWLGEGRGYSKVLAMTLGTGLGSAYIENGLPVVNREDVAPHGSLWHLPWKEGIADAYFSTRGCLAAYESLSGKRADGVKMIAEAAQRGDKPARQMFQEFGTEMGHFLLPWLQKFQADVLVFGGNIARAHPLFFPALEAFFQENNLPVNIRFSRFMEDAALIGAARCLNEDFWNQIKTELPVI